MQFYSSLSQIGFLKKSYALKFLFVAFLGIHVPLIGVLVFILFFETMFSATTVIIVVLALTLIATGVTLVILKKLISPIEKTSKALDAYRTSRVVPNLPADFNDEAGLLMGNILFTIRNIENLLTEKQDTAYLLSHDLKNFAETPASLAKLILEEDVSLKVNEYSNMIILSSQRQMAFLKTFIGLLKEEDELSKKALKVTTIDFIALFSSVQSILAPKLNEKNIKLNVKLDVSSVMVRADKELLRQVIINLIDNSIKFSYPGSEVNVSAERIHSMLQITVKDDGIGFDPSKSDEIFRKFTPMGRPGTADEPSTGIGLYLCRQILKKSDGALSATSRGANQGATFEISLKVYKRRHV